MRLSDSPRGRAVRCWQCWYPAGCLWRLSVPFRTLSLASLQVFWDQQSAELPVGHSGENSHSEKKQNPGQTPQLLHPESLLREKLTVRFRGRLVCGLILLVY